MFRCSAHQLDNSGSGHCGSNADFGLTSADGTGNGCIEHGKIANGRTGEECVDDLVIGEIIFFLKCQKDTWNNTG